MGSRVRWLPFQAVAQKATVRAQLALHAPGADCKLAGWAHRACTNGPARVIKGPAVAWGAVQAVALQVRTRSYGLEGKG